MWAQSNTIQISGKVLDALSKEVLPYVSIIVKTPTDEFVEGVATNAEGQYSMKLAKGVYLLQFSFIGYKSGEKHIELNNSQVIDLFLEADLTTLETVEVNAERTSVEQRIDRKVIHVGKDLQSSGGDALEVLSQLAEVQTNPDGGVELRGSGNVNLLVNGKPSPLAPQDLLQQIDATEIERIELITTPSAKHRADGLTGIINIITQKKKKRGFSGSINGSISTNPQYRGSAQLAFGSKKLNLSLNTTFSDSEFDSQINRSRVSESFNYAQNGASVFSGQVKSLKAGLDWFASPKDEFSFNYSFTDNAHDIINTAQILEDTLNYDYFSANRHVHLSAEYSLNYRKIFDTKDHYLEADFHLSDNQNDLGANYEAGPEIWSSFLDYNTKITNLSLDYALPFKEWKVTFEAGGLYTAKKVNNEQSAIDIHSESTQNKFHFTEKSIGLYTLIKKDWKKLGAQAGFRYEGFWSESTFFSTQQPINRIFHNLFPSLHLSYQLNDTYSLGFGYNQRISRPNLWQINPFANATDRFFNRRGNTGLKPEYSHNFEWNLSSKFQHWSFNPGLFYRYKSNLILPIYEADNERFVLQSFANQGNSHAYGTELALSIFPLAFLKTHINATIYQENIAHKNSTNYGFLNLNRHNLTIKNLFQINKHLNFDISWAYRGGGTYRFSQTAATGKVDLALGLKVLQNRGKLNLRLTDVFNTFEWTSTFYGIGFEEQSFRKRETRVFYLSFNYQFAKGESAQKRQRKNRRFDEPGATE